MKAILVVLRANTFPVALVCAMIAVLVAGNQSSLAYDELTSRAAEQMWGAQCRVSTAQATSQGCKKEFNNCNCDGTYPNRACTGGGDGAATGCITAPTTPTKASGATVPEDDIGFCDDTAECGSSGTFTKITCSVSGPGTCVIDSHCTNESPGASCNTREFPSINFCGGF